MPDAVFCPSCGHDTAAAPRSGRPAFHIALALLTAGLWLPVWMAFSVIRRGRKCRECGSPVEVAGEEGPILAVLRRRLARHFERYRGLGPWSFTWRIALESIVAGIVAGLFAALVFPFGREDRATDGATFFLAAVAVAPVLETVLFQAIPIEIARRLGAGPRLQIAISTLPFAAAHFLRWGPVSGIAAGLVGGFYLAFTYSWWRTRSPWTAAWTTAVSHALHNGVLFAALVAFGAHP